MGLKLNPFTGKFDLVNPASPDNFSYNYITVGKMVNVPLYQQMLVHESMAIDGVLEINGELILLDFGDAFVEPEDEPEILGRMVTTEVTESIDIYLYDLIIQTASGITTSLSNPDIGSTITITNRSGGDNTLNLTVQGCVSPTISDLESFSLFYNGTDYELI